MKLQELVNTLCNILASTQGDTNVYIDGSEKELSINVTQSGIILK